MKQTFISVVSIFSVKLIQNKGGAFLCGGWSIHGNGTKIHLVFLSVSFTQDCLWLKVLLSDTSKRKATFCSEDSNIVSWPRYAEENKPSRFLPSYFSCITTSTTMASNDLRQDRSCLKDNWSLSSSSWRNQLGVLKRSERQGALCSQARLLGTSLCN